MVNFLLIISTLNTSQISVHNVQIWDKNIKNWNISDHYQIYLLFACLKITYMPNELKRSGEIVDILV